MVIFRENANEEVHGELFSGIVIGVGWLARGRSEPLLLLLLSELSCLVVSR
jgi:hypothetical protein